MNVLTVPLCPEPGLYGQVFDPPRFCAADLARLNGWQVGDEIRPWDVATWATITAIGDQHLLVRSQTRYQSGCLGGTYVHEEQCYRFLAAAMNVRRRTGELS